VSTPPCTSTKDVWEGSPVLTWVGLCFKDCPQNAISNLISAGPLIMPCPLPGMEWNCVMLPAQQRKLHRSLQLAFGAEALQFVIVSMEP